MGTHDPGRAFEPEVVKVDHQGTEKKFHHRDTEKKILFFHFFSNLSNTIGANGRAPTMSPL
jgi:hypothetical protein